MLKDAAVVILSSIDWEFNRQNPQEAAIAFAAHCKRVLFIENTGARSVTWRDRSRLATRLVNWWRARGGTSPREGNIDVLSPVVLPMPYSRIATMVNARMLAKTIRRWSERAGGGPLIFVSFLPTPLALQMIRALHPALVVYYCIDRLAESSPGARRIEASERVLLAQSDVVLVTATSLYEMAAPIASHVEILASGVHLAAYEDARRRRSEPHPELDSLPRPLIGFVGTVRDATDIHLLAAVAQFAPDMSFLVAGPHTTDVSPLAEFANVHLIGEVSHTEVMRYVVRFDVGILPYALTPFTASIMPVKLKEYLAGGLPIVSTRLPEVVSFANDHPGLIEFADDAAGFVRALRLALTHRDDEVIARRLTVAQRFDWSQQMQQMIARVEETLAGRRPSMPRAERIS